MCSKWVRIRLLVTITEKEIGSGLSSYQDNGPSPPEKIVVRNE
jgi:hypothetical protein